MESEKVTSTAADNVIAAEPTHAPPPYYGPSQPPPLPQQAAFAGPGGVMVLNTGPAMGTKPTTYICPSCHARIVTNVETKVTLRTHMFAFVFCMMGCLPCIAIPYFVDSCKNIDHYCPECNAFIGSYRIM